MAIFSGKDSVLYVVCQACSGKKIALPFICISRLLHSDGSGTIEWEEFLALMVIQLKGATEVERCHILVPLSLLLLGTHLK